MSIALSKTFNICISVRTETWHTCSCISNAEGRRMLIGTLPGLGEKRAECRQPVTEFLQIMPYVLSLLIDLAIYHYYVTIINLIN